MDQVKDLEAKLANLNQSNEGVSKMITNMEQLQFKAYMGIAQDNVKLKQKMTTFAAPILNAIGSSPGQRMFSMQSRPPGVPKK